MIGLVVIILIAFVVAFFLFTKTGKRLRLRVSGTAEEVINKDASTPDGAKAYYNTAISKKEEAYQDAYHVYTQMLGKIQSFEEQLRSLQKENMQLSLNVNTCVEQNNDEGAKVYLLRQEEVSEKVDIIKKALKELRENSVLQKETVDSLFDELGNLKAEKETAILTLETAQATKTLQATANISGHEEDKMLEKVREGIKKTKEEAEGNKVAYENSSTVRQQRLDKKIKSDIVEKKLNELKQQKNK